MKELGKNIDVWAEVLFAGGGPRSGRVNVERLV